LSAYGNGVKRTLIDSIINGNKGKYIFTIMAANNSKTEIDDCDKIIIKV
jgi:hypothetical protein